MSFNYSHDAEILFIEWEKSYIFGDVISKTPEGVSIAVKRSERFLQDCEEVLIAFPELINKPVFGMLGLIEELSKRYKPSVLAALASRIEYPPSIDGKIFLEDLLETDSKDIIAAVVQRDVFPDGIEPSKFIYDLSFSKNAKIRAGIAGRIDFPDAINDIELINRLSRDPHWLVRAAVADRLNIPEGIDENLAMNQYI